MAMGGNYRFPPNLSIATIIATLLKRTMLCLFLWHCAQHSLDFRTELITAASSVFKPMGLEFQKRASLAEWVLDELGSCSI